MAHGYESYLGAPYTNAPMCAMDSDGISQKVKSGPNYCFMTANDTVVPPESSSSGTAATETPAAKGAAAGGYQWATPP